MVVESTLYAYLSTLPYVIVSIKRLMDVNYLKDLELKGDKCSGVH